MKIDTLVTLKDIEINPSEHSVEDPSLALKTDPKEGFKRGIARIIGTIVVVAIIVGISVAVNNKFFGYIGAGSIIVGLMGIAAIIKSMFISGIKPNLKTPEEALRSFLYAIDNGLYGRAYNMLTDQAKVAGDVPIPKEVKMEKSLSRIANLETFTKYWQNTGLKISDINNTILFWRQKCEEENTAVFVANIPMGTTSQSFHSKYVLVKRGELWFVAHGYLII